tara:strand:- start:84 stop:212 length:129 start_codon:yes stop_codon:yes gene_type:complete
MCVLRRRKKEKERRKSEDCEECGRKETTPGSKKDTSRKGERL